MTTRVLRMMGPAALAFAGAIAMSGATWADPIELSLSGHKFSPATIEGPANQKFQIKVTNHDITPSEFESHDLKVEKIVVAGGTVTVTVGPLKPGAYKFFDDYHPEAGEGVLTVKE